MHCPFYPCTYKTNSTYSLRRHEAQCIYKPKGHQSVVRMETGSSAMEASRDCLAEAVKDDDHQVASGPSQPDLAQTSLDHHSFLGIPPEQTHDEFALEGSSGANDDTGEDMLMNVIQCILRLERSTGSKKVNALLDIFKQEFFNFQEFRRYATSVRSCKNFVALKIQRAASQKGFHRICHQIPAIETGTILYAKEVVEVLQRHVSFASTKTFSFRPPSQQPNTYIQ